MHTTTKLLGGMIIGVAAVAVAGTAYAAPPSENEHYEWSESGTFQECGLSLQGVSSGSGHLLVREVRGSDGQAYLGLDNYTFRDVITNTENGEWLVIHGRGTAKEMAAVHVEGDIWEFTTQETGQPLVIEDSSGTVVLRDRGRQTFRVLFDTLGDGASGGVTLEEELTGVSGMFPSFDTSFCEVVTDLIG